MPRSFKISAVIVRFFKTNDGPVEIHGRAGADPPPGSRICRSPDEKWRPPGGLRLRLGRDNLFAIIALAQKLHQPVSVKIDVVECLHFWVYEVFPSPLLGLETDLDHVERGNWNVVALSSVTGVC